MFNYIKADIYRISHNKKLWIYFGSLIILSAALIFYFNTKGVFSYSSDRFPMMLAIAFDIVPFAIGIPLFISIYEDDLKFDTLQFALTSQINKLQFIFSKLIISLIMIISIFTILLGYTFILSRLISTISNKEWIQLILLGITVILSIFIYFSLCALLGFITQNSTMGTIFFILSMTGVISALFSQLSEVLKFLKPIVEYTPDSLLTSLRGQLNVTNSLDISTIIQLLLYVVVTSVISAIVLSKIEIKTA